MRMLSPEDHPRSRGVYWALTSALISLRKPGSSPLTRGLRRQRRRHRRRGGIIPARAGFTPGLSNPSWRFSDHPRSRGVYFLLRFSVLLMCGSSPLARGLPSVVGLAGSGWRIIPARAGFTKPRRNAAPEIKDHPRSRGVYGGQVWGQPHSPGSSPLARGLPVRARRRISPGGIIPARAGFTWRLRLDLGCVLGSSPLARGLPCPSVCLCFGHRIIPARAGFTGEVAPLF